MKTLKPLVILRSCLLAGVLLLLLSSAAGAAEPYPPCVKEVTDDDIAAAKSTHQAAGIAYGKKSYTQAILLWKQAYSFDCRANGLLVNIGNAYEKLGEAEKAIEAFQAYVDRAAPNDDPSPATIAEGIHNLKKLLIETPKPKPDKPKPDKPKPDKPEPDEPINPFPWVVVGGGGVLVVIGAILIPLGQGDISDAEGRCTTETADGKLDCKNDPEGDPNGAAELGNSGRTKVAAGGVLVGVGAAAVIGGLVWYFLDDSGEEDQSTSLDLEPAFAPGYAGLSLTGRF